MLTQRNNGEPARRKIDGGRRDQRGTNGGGGGGGGGSGSGSGNGGGNWLNELSELATRRSKR